MNLPGMSIADKQQMITLMSASDSATMFLAMDKIDKRALLSSTSVAEVTSFFLATPAVNRAAFFSSMTSAKQAAMLEAMTPAKRKELSTQVDLSVTSVADVRCAHCKVAKQTQAGSAREFWQCTAEGCSNYCCDSCCEIQQLCPACRGVGCLKAIAGCHAATCRIFRIQHQQKEAQIRTAKASAAELVEMLDSNEEAVRVTAYNRLSAFTVANLQKLKKQLAFLFTNTPKVKTVRQPCAALLRRLPSKNSPALEEELQAFDDRQAKFTKSVNHMNSQGINH